MTRSAPVGSVWVMGMVAVAAAVGLGVLATMVTVADQVAPGSSAAAVANGGVFAVAIGVGCWTMLARDASLAARGAVVVTASQLAIMWAAAGLWATFEEAPQARLFPMIRELPAMQWALGAGAALVVLAALTARRRRGAPWWLRTTVLFALVFLLVVACWLAVMTGATKYAPADEAELLSWIRGRAVHVFAVPAVVTVVVVALMVLRRRLGRRNRLPILVALTLVPVLVAGAFRSTGLRHDNIAFGNYVHVIFAAATLALLSLVALAVAHARGLAAHRRDARRGAPWAQEGVVVVEPGADPVVGHVEDLGYLEGLRTTAGAFMLRTAHGDLPVPAGASLIVPIPGATSVVQTGARIPALYAGQQVVVTGFVAPATDGPFRASSLLTPAPAGLVVTRVRGDDESISRDVLLLIWRPCVLFLVVTALAAFPGLCGSYT